MPFTYMACLLCNVCGGTRSQVKDDRICYSATTSFSQPHSFYFNFLDLHVYRFIYLHLPLAHTCTRANGAVCSTRRTFENEIKDNDYFDEKNNNFDQEEVTINRLLATYEWILFFYRKILLRVEIAVHRPKNFISAAAAATPKKKKKNATET